MGSVRPRPVSPRERLSRELALVVADSRLDSIPAGADYVLLAIEAPDEDQAQERERVRSLKDRLPNLERVLATPESSIGEEHVVLRASRVRRIAPEAVGYLARHSADLRSFRFGRPVPERLLAIETFDDLDVYENRLALHTRDEIERQLQRRSDAARDEARLLDAIAERLLDAGLDHRVGRRLAQLLGSQESAGSAAEDAASRKQQREDEAATLDELAAQVGHLAFATLSMAIRDPERRRVPEFHLVNRLAVHLDYREVGKLFTQWVEGRTLGSATIDDADLKWLAARRYDAYVAMLVCQALRQMRLVAPAGAELRRGGDAVVFTRGTRPADVRRGGRSAAPRAAAPRIALRWVADGALELDRMLVWPGDGALPPLADPAARIVARIDDDDRGGRPASTDRVLCVVTPPPDDAANGWTAAPDHSPYLLHASPGAIDGAERLLAVLRKLLWEPAYAGYPHAGEIDAPVGEQLLVSCSDWLRRAGAPKASAIGVAVHAATPVSPAALVALVRDAVTAAHPDRREREHSRHADGVLEILLRARAWHGWWATCPLCGDAPMHDREGPSDDFFRYRCGSCKCRWGVLVCRCNRRTALIEPYDIRAHDLSGNDGRAPTLNGDLVARRLVHEGEDRWLCEQCFAATLEEAGIQSGIRNDKHELYG